MNTVGIIIPTKENFYKLACKQFEKDYKTMNFNLLYNCK